MEIGGERDVAQRSKFVALRLPVRWNRLTDASQHDLARDGIEFHVASGWQEWEVASDLALDVLPSRVAGFELPVHWVCGVAMGTPILDNCDFENLSAEANARKRWSSRRVIGNKTFRRNEPCGTSSTG